MSTTPRFGRPMRALWAMEPDLVYLNHGSVGAPPKRVLEAQRRICDEIERQPSRFLLRELSAISVGPSRRDAPRLRVAAGAVARFLGARERDLAFVENATTGVNAVLRSLSLREGDEILITDHAYGAVANAARHAAQERRARVRTVELPYPRFDPDAAVGAFRGALSPRSRLAIVDHITSESALILPVRAIADLCREAGVAVLIDGAHAPGAIALDIPSLRADWYTGNLHKWAWAPRSCGILWAAPKRQEGLHPTVISWGLGRGFSEEFDWVGTRDPSAYLAAPEAIAHMEEIGLDALRRYNHDLAWEAARYLSRRWGTELGMAEADVGTMVTIPLPERAGSSKPDAVSLRTALLEEDRVEVQIHAWKERLWVRISAQIYNDRADVEQLARAVDARI